MDPGTIVGITGSGIAVITLWVNFNQYRLQKIGNMGKPGQKVDPKKASDILAVEVKDDPVRVIASNHIFVGHEIAGVGYIEKKPIGVYLDLHTAATIVKQRKVLAESLATFVCEVAGVEPFAPNVLVASPREGNLLVGSAVAEQLSIGFLMIRTGRAPRFGYPIEGIFQPGSTAVLVDDLCMEGSFLGRCVRTLRRYGLNVSHCVCLFERTDGDAREVLEAMSVKFRSRYQIDDEQLMKLKPAGGDGTAILREQ